MDSNKLKLMVEVSKLYYIEGLSQSQIANIIFISRPQVSRILSEAREKKIVTITVKDPFSEEYTIANQIKEEYKLAQVLVVDTNNQDPLRVLAHQVSRLLSSKVHSGHYIGISAGKTLAMCSRHTTIYNSKDLKFIPLLAGSTFQGIDWYANNNCQRFSERMDSNHMVLSTPLVIEEEEIREKLKENEAIRPVFMAYEKLDVILTGIGQTTKDSSLSECDISDEEILQAHKHGAQAIIAGSFVDKDGNEILKDQSNKFLGAKIEHLKRCPCVIAIAEGENKIQAIQSILKGGFIDIFCTSLKTGKELLK